MAEPEQQDPDAPEETQEAPEEHEEDHGDEFDVDRAKAKIAKANQEAKNLRDRLKAAEEKAKKFDELEEAKKPELERLSSKATEAEERARRAETDLARLRVALKHGLTEAQAKRLVGDTEDELDADAVEFLADLKSTDDTPHPRRPVPRLRGGGDPDQEPDETDPQKLADQMGRL